MRIPSIPALCLAGMVSLAAAGQSAQSMAPAQSAQSKDSNTPPAEQKTATGNATAQATSQPDGAKKPETKSDWLRPALLLPAQKSGTQRKWPQMSFDKGIYAGRNNLAVSGTCLAIQSYNFSSGPNPQLESITTCTTIERPLMLQVKKPESQNQQSGQKEPEKNQK
ncbi:MAG TPA: hypothetical protein VHA33_21145 [Candidatus Angelobacter sp.]|jgi:hypothetical protein|nr:hypothetical protein [Candidatus Angelobacter sp.]